MEKNYWVFRIDTKNREYLYKELKENNILRQGWGWDEIQDLRNHSVDASAIRNLPIFNKVKKGDILLVPRIGRWDGVVIVEALSDWNSKDGYDFEIAEDYGDYGHCFSAKIVDEFVRNNANVKKGIRSTLRAPSRFWNINYLKENVELLIKEQSDLKSNISITERVGLAINQSMDESSFEDILFEKFISHFQSSEWEDVLVYIYQEIYPEYIVENIGGANEKEHGADILIKIPGLKDEVEYAIVIQVKDYVDVVSESVIDQINKADSYCEDHGINLIDKYIFVTNTRKDINYNLEQNKGDVKILYKEDLSKLLYKYVIKEREIQL